MAYRVGIVGGGNISVTHARAAAEAAGAEVVAVWGHNRDKGAQLAEQFGASAHATVEELLVQAKPDVVLIGSPSGVHAEHAIAAARQGCHVLVEKPLEITTERVDRIIEECDRAGVQLGVFFQDRTAPDIAWLKRMLEAGALGRVHLAAASVRWYRPPEYYGGSKWRGTWALDGGGALMNQGIHTVDLLLWLLGDVERLYAQTRTAVHDIEVEDTVAACLEFAGGGVATLEAATSAYPGFPRTITLSGSEGTVVLEHDRIRSVDLRTPPPEPAPGALGTQNASSSSPVVSDVSGHRRVVEDFLRSIDTGTRPLCDGRDGRRSVRLVEAIYHSSREGQAVVL